MKGEFDAYVLWPLAKRVQNGIVGGFTARDFTEGQIKKRMQIIILDGKWSLTTN